MARGRRPTPISKINLANAGQALLLAASAGERTKDIAAELGVSSAAVSWYRHGRRTPGAELREAIAQRYPDVSDRSWDLPPPGRLTKERLAEVLEPRSAFAAREILKEEPMARPARAPSAIRHLNCGQRLFLYATQGAVCAELARVLGVTPAAITHFRTGRIKPKPDVRRAIAARWPLVSVAAWDLPVGMTPEQLAAARKLYGISDDAERILRAG